MIRCMSCMSEYNEMTMTRCPACGFASSGYVGDAAELPPGTIVGGRYSIGKRLDYDSNSYSISYAAWDNEKRCRVSIVEFYPREFVSRDQSNGMLIVGRQDLIGKLDVGKKSFVTEGKKLKKLYESNQKIWRVYDSFLERNTAYMVTEFLEGQTLEQYVSARKKMDYPESASVFREVLSALGTAHDGGIIHKYICPRNIFLCSDGRVVLINYGAYRSGIAESSRSIASTLEIGFAPCEQYSAGQLHNKSVDIYAVGASMHYALTGTKPPASTDRADKDTLVPIDKAVKGIPKNTAYIIMNALNMKPENRPHHILEFLSAIEGKGKVIRKKEKLKKEIVALPKWLIPAMVLTALAAIGFFAWKSLDLSSGKAEIPDGMTQVPNISDMSVGDAYTTLEECSLSLVISGLVYDDFLEKDTVLMQSPSPGSLAYVGSMVEATVSAPEENVSVPDVLGFDANNATAALETAGFVVVTRDEYSDDYALGTVIYQSISSEDTAKPGTVIELVISLGPENDTLDTSLEVNVPVIVGMTFEQAQAELMNCGLYITKSAAEYSAAVPAGQIITQDPAAGQQLHQGDTVAVVVSAGKQTVTVPDLSYLTEAAAREKLASVDLGIIVNYEQSQSVSAGLVIRQDISSGFTLEPGDTITVWVSTGYQVSVPDCVGKNQAEAISALTSARLSYAVNFQNSTTIPAGKVISQSVAHGESVEQGTTIVLTVSSGASTVAVTGVYVSPTKYSMSIGDSTTLVAAIQPSNATTSTVTWKSSNTSVAQVSSNGTVTAKGTGTATITAITTDGGKTASCTITVTKTLSYISVTSVPSKTVYYTGDSLDKSGLAVKATYNDGSTADVTGKCSLSGFGSSSAGTKTVTVSYSDSGVSKSATFVITVIEPYLIFTDPPSTMEVGDTAVLSYDLVPSGVSLSWASSYSDIASVTNGTVTAKSAGSTNIYADFTYNGRSYGGSFTITVESSVDTSMFQYRIENGTAIITGYSGSSTDINIPSKIDGYTVSEIGRGAFYESASIRTVTIPESVTTISTIAFRRCTSLTNVTLHYGLKHIGNLAFDGCTSLKSITIPDSVTTIDDYAFSDCTSLTSINIPDSATSLGEGLFSNCASLSSLEIPDGTTQLGDYFACDCTSLSSVTIPDSITSIGDYAFADCGLVKQIQLPDGVTSISQGAFQNCTSLTSFVIPNGAGSIGNQAFYNCTSLTGVTIPDSVTDIGNFAFANCSLLEKISIPDSVSYMGNGVLENCTSLTNVRLPNGLTDISPLTFSNCGLLTSVSLPNGVRTIGYSAFEGCSSLSGITLPSNLTLIDYNAFDSCTALTSVVIPNGVTGIDQNAFALCTSLNRIQIPASVTNIGTAVFAYCNNLTIYCDAGTTAYSVFSNEGYNILPYSSFPG